MRSVTVFFGIHSTSQIWCIVRLLWYFTRKWHGDLMSISYRALFRGCGRGLADGQGDTMTGCGKGSAPMRRPRGRWGSCIKGMQVSPCSAPVSGTGLFSFHPQSSPSRPAGVLPSSVPPQAYADVADGCCARSNTHSQLRAWHSPGAALLCPQGTKPLVAPHHVVCPEYSPHKLSKYLFSSS